MNLSTRNSHGYVLEYAPTHPRASRDGYVFKHILVAEKALGKCLPLGVEVHHFDLTRRNNRRNNLVICENHAYHGLLHSRTRIVKQGGDPDTQKICSSCKQLKSQNYFGYRERSPDGLREDCTSCVSIANSKRVR